MWYFIIFIDVIFGFSRLESLEIAHPRFWKFNSKYLANIYHTFKFLIISGGNINYVALLTRWCH
jgi:hypothetical protein